jgi:hypothetical protein
MQVITEIQTSMKFTKELPDYPSDFLNCYELENISSLSWPVNLFTVRRIDGKGQRHEDRSDLKDIIFRLKMKHRARCPGYGFIVDTDKASVVVPADWNIPEVTDFDGYDVNFSHTFLASANDPNHRSIIFGILREGIKKHFKDHLFSHQLGSLWQNYGSFCQMPDETAESGHSLCRRFTARIAALRSNRIAVECVVNTTMIDGRTVADYYRAGEIDVLAEMIEAKRQYKLTRKDLPPSIRVWHNLSSDHMTAAEVLEIENPDEIIIHAKLEADAQRTLTIDSINCLPFRRPSVPVPLRELRLILGSSILGEGQSETILEPDEREKFGKRMRDFISGADIYGKNLTLAKLPVDASKFPNLLIAPPAVRVRNRSSESVIPVPALDKNAETNLTDRARERATAIRKHGFLQRRNINPVLAFPEKFGPHSPQEMRNFLNRIWERQGINFRFEVFRYAGVEQLGREIERVGYDSAVVVLPERSSWGNRPNDTHEMIKKRIQVPTQCIHIDHTTPREWVGKSFSEFINRKPRLANRIRQIYELCLLNLLVKHGWVPFAPFDPFHYNVQIGLDVGGRYNDRVMACLGYGFSKPSDGLIFLPTEISIDVKKGEPIPSDCLFQGLLKLFEFMHAQLLSAHVIPDYEKTLFLRDGSLLGDGDAWNERQALEKLHSELLNRKWLTENSRWTAVELSKRAEDLRLFRNNSGIENPLAGKCVFPFDNDFEALICTTGVPYLTQGTAAPVLARVSNIFGTAVVSEAIRDVVWGADMSFTKPDTGIRLPWVLHVADSGALQLSRAYKISGITA